MPRIKGTRVTHGDVQQRFGGKQAPPFGKKGKAEEKGEPKMKGKAKAKEEKAEGE